MLSAPSFPTTQFASLDSLGDELSGISAHPTGTTVLVAGCCVGMLDTPNFAAFHVASLESLGSELSGLPKDNLLVATPCV